MTTAIWSVTAEPESVAQVRDGIARFARGHGADHELEQRLKLAVSEAVSNAVLHAYEPGEEGTIEVRAQDPDHEIVVEVVDHGRGVRPRPDSPGLGLGLPLIAQLADRFSIAEADGWTSISMTFGAPEAA